MAKLYVAFKGDGNSSNKIVKNLSGDKLFLTNSYGGLKKDVENIGGEYDFVYMFGLDKNLKGSVRLERLARKNEITLRSVANCDLLAENLTRNGIAARACDKIAVPSLCNDAYFFMLEKFNRRAAFFHVPSAKYISEDFIEKMKKFFNSEAEFSRS